MKTTKPTTLAKQLRWQLVLVAVSLGIAIVISLSFITWRSVDFAADNILKMEALILERQVRADANFVLPNNEYFRIYRSIDEVPQAYFDAFSGMGEDGFENAEDIEANVVYETLVTNQQGIQDYMSLLKHVASDGLSLYVFSFYGARETDEFINQITQQMLEDAAWLLFFVYLALFLLIVWLFRRTNEPMVLLSRWAQKLKADGKLVQEEFPITELNELAKQLKSGVDRVGEFNDREQQFLKHASHEMRTPLATIQACLDTLDFQLKGPESKTVRRALRASDNMRRLSQALLWLARESDKSVEKTELHLPSFVKEHVNAHQYLLQNRSVDIQQHVADVQLTIEADLLQIVFVNLLRNACQYTQEGQIDIEMNQHSLSIRNPYDDQRDEGLSSDETPSRDEGPISHEGTSKSPDYQSFGLGLQLVSRICEKVGWQFEFIQGPNSIETVSQIEKVGQIEKARQIEKVGQIEVVISWSS